MKKIVSHGIHCSFNHSRSNNSHPMPSAPHYPHPPPPHPKPGPQSSTYPQPPHAATQPYTAAHSYPTTNSPQEKARTRAKVVLGAIGTKATGTADRATKNQIPTRADEPTAKVRSPHVPAYVTSNSTDFGLACGPVQSANTEKARVMAHGLNRATKHCFMSLAGASTGWRVMWTTWHPLQIRLRNTRVFVCRC